MVTSLPNLKFELFADKEHYKAFRQAWKDYINAGNHKPYYEEDAYGGKVKVSRLTAVHHLLYYIILGKDLSVVFKSPNNPDRDPAFRAAYADLKWVLPMVKSIAAYDKGDESSFPKYLSKERVAMQADAYRARVNRLIEPFGDTLDCDTLIKLCDKIGEVQLTNTVS